MTPSSDVPPQRFDQLSPGPFETLAAQAHERRLTVSQWVRDTLRKARRTESRAERIARVHDALQRAAAVHAPAPDIDTMNAEIDRGYRHEPADSAR